MQDLDNNVLPEGFDGDIYLRLNPDVADSGIDPIVHYLQYGYKENRLYSSKTLPLLSKVRGSYNHDGLSSIHNHDFMCDESFIDAYNRGVKATQDDYKWYWRVHIGLWAAKTAMRINGDFIECGVNKGFLSSAIMQYLDWNSVGRTFYLLDTFGGLDESLITEVEFKAGVLDRNRNEINTNFYTSDVESVTRNFSEWDNVRIIQGSIPNSLNNVKSNELAFLHIDLNCSLPEVAAIDKLWPLLNVGGIVLLDDYAFFGFQTQKDAMDQWAKNNGVAIASLPTGQGLIVK